MPPTRSATAGTCLQASLDTHVERVLLARPRSFCAGVEMAVIGSATSSNTLALARVARAAAPLGRPVVRVDGPDEMPPDLRGTVGVTAGASAAEEVVQSVVAGWPLATGSR